MTAGEQRSFSYFSGDWTYRFSWFSYVQNIHFKAPFSHFHSKTSLLTGLTGFHAKHTPQNMYRPGGNIQYYGTRHLTPESQDIREHLTEYCFCVFPETTRTCWGFGTVAPSLASPAAVLMATVSLSPLAIRTGQTNELKHEKHTYLSKNSEALSP